MRTVFRIEYTLFKSIHADLSRPHTFAFERIGFISCRTGTLRDGVVLLAHMYHPVADDDYEDGHGVGAMIGSRAIRKSLQLAYNNLGTIMLHVHRHEHHGIPRFSSVDMTESAKLIPDFWKVRPNVPHGILILSHDAMFGMCWNPITRQPEPIRELSIIGRPLKTFRYEYE
jgi:hypothetical protein